MLNANTKKIESVSISNKLKFYAELLKLKITLFVVVSAILGYFIGMNSFVIEQLIWLTIGGFLVTGSANAFNQIIERNHDKLMDRTKNRPLPLNKLNVKEVTIVALVSGVVGVILLWVFLNPTSGVLGLLAIFMYAAVYTPLKRISPIAVFVGAFPGAIPPMLGWVAADGYFSFEAGMLFALQFVWQFPHFWAIAWRLHPQYQKAGFKMLPFDKKNKTSAVCIFLSSVVLLLGSYLPEYYQVTGRLATVVLSVLALLMVIPSVQLMKTQDDKYALRTMLMSYVYLIFSLLIILIDKV